VSHGPGEQGDWLRRQLIHSSAPVGCEGLPENRNFLPEFVLERNTGQQEAQTLMRVVSDLEDRLLEIENSRFFRALQWPRRFWLNWKGRLGQKLLPWRYNADRMVSDYVRHAYLPAAGGLCSA
jgi:hypothetical protein